MGIMMITSLNSYAKTISMAMKWQKRQEENNYAPGSTDPGSVQDSFQKQPDQIRYPGYDRSSQMEGDIEIKLTAGKRLSAEEMLYLKNHDRSTYQKARIINRERGAYEKALAACKTRDEVEQLKARYAEAAVKRINAIRNNPTASRDCKRELFQMEHYKAAALDDAMYQFIKSSEYKALPSAPSPLDTSPENQSAMAEAGNQNSGSQTPVSGLTAEFIERQQTAQTKAAEEAAEYEIPDSADGQEKQFVIPDQSEDNACEEGSIMKAILDEEARWAQESEDERNVSDPQDVTPAHPEEPYPGFGVKQARAAYLAARFYEAGTKTPVIDVIK